MRAHLFIVLCKRAGYERVRFRNELNNGKAVAEQKLFQVYIAASAKYDADGGVEVGR